MTTQQIIDFFKMKPLLQEGGYYVETCRPTDKIAAEALGQRYHGHRNLSSAMPIIVSVAESHFRNVTPAKLAPVKAGSYGLKTGFLLSQE